MGGPEETTKFALEPNFGKWVSHERMGAKNIPGKKKSQSTGTKGLKCDLYLQNRAKCHLANKLSYKSSVDSKLDWSLGTIL